MNREYLVEQFRLIEDYLGRARLIAGRRRDEFLSDKILVDAATRELTVLFETAHNIAKHLIASEQWRGAESKAEAFEILAENGVISESLCKALRQASRFRNLVTYQTTAIDDGLIYQILVDRLGDFERFALDVARWLEPNASR